MYTAFRPLHQGPNAARSARHSPVRSSKASNKGAQGLGIRGLGFRDFKKGFKGASMDIGGYIGVYGI